MRRLSSRLNAMFLSITLGLVVLATVILVITAQTGAMNRKYNTLHKLYSEVSRVMANYRNGILMSADPWAVEQLEGESDEDMVVTFMTLATMKEAINSISRTAGARTYVWRFHEVALEDLPEQVEALAITEDVRRAKNGYSTFRAPSNWFTGSNQLVTFVGPLDLGKGIEGAIIIYTFSEDMFAETQAAWTWILIGGTFVMVILVVCIQVISRRITMPLRQMSTAATRLAEGDDVPDIPITTEDEVGDLSRAFNYMRSRLAANERMRRDFFAGVSHDLRTPLTSIYGFVKGLKEGWIPQEQMPETLDILTHETRRLQDMTDTLLDLARLEGGVLEIKREHIRVKALLDEAIHASNVDAALTCPEGCVVAADRRLLHRAVSNLIENAKRYGAPPYELTVKETEDQISIHVRDHGKGVPEDMQSRIFEQYYSGGKGSGLGLFLVLETMRLHGGTAEAANLSDGGFEIVLRLPT